MWFSRQHAKEGSFHWHLWEVHGHVSKHLTWKNIFHTHGTILGLAGLKLLAAEAFILKMLAGPALVIKGAIVAGMSAIPFFTNAGFVTVADKVQPQVIKAQRASSSADQQTQGQAGQPTRAGSKTISSEDSFKADLKNIRDGFAETPLYDPAGKKLKNKATNTTTTKSSEGSQQAASLQIPDSDPSVGTTTLKGAQE